MTEPKAVNDVPKSSEQVSSSPRDAARLKDTKPEIDSSSQESFPDINEKALVRKLDYKLLPALTFLYLLSFLDRSNVGNARIEGLVKDLNMTGNEYLTSLTLFWWVESPFLSLLPYNTGLMGQLDDANNFTVRARETLSFILSLCRYS